MPESTLIDKRYEDFNAKTEFDFRNHLNEIERSNTTLDGSKYKQCYRPNQELKKVKKLEGITIIKEKNQPEYTFWNKVSFLIGKRNHQKYIHNPFGKIEISDSSTGRPLLIRQTRKRCLGYNSECKTQVSEYSHDICFYCSIFEKESEEYTYHYKSIKHLLTSNHFLKFWY